MGLFETPPTHDALQSVLNEEREAILAAKFEVLERLSAEKQRLTQILQTETTDEKTLSSLKSQIERNGLLLDAMRDGVGSALESLRALRDAGEALRTYDETGRRKTILSMSGKTIRRA